MPARITSSPSVTGLTPASMAGARHPPATPASANPVDGLAAQHAGAARASIASRGLAAIRNTVAGCASALAGLARRTLGEPAGTRRNHYFGSGDENNNIHTVIHTPVVPESSAGFRHQKFFEEIGDRRHAHYDDSTLGPETPSTTLAGRAATTTDKAVYKQCVDALRRRAEQEYLMQGMPKGAMVAAADIATRHRTGIAVRPTGLLAHMGIESGMPVKAQEFKNKTSKEVDLWLCDELNWKDVGKVVHYDPRVGWSSTGAGSASGDGTALAQRKPPTKEDWKAKLAYIRDVRHAQLKEQLGDRIGDMPPVEELEKAFFSRAGEYLAEDHAYRHGELAPHVLLDGPRLRLKARPGEDMVGDLDLFVFTTETVEHSRDGTSTTHQSIEFDEGDHNAVQTQKALQSSSAFQAQHGAVWYWDPSTNKDQQAARFNEGIRNTIMAAHSPGAGDPLIHIQPDNRVSAVFYDPTARELRSVWEEPSSTAWLARTHSGALLLKLQAEGQATSRA